MAKWLNKIYPGDAVFEDEPRTSRLRGRYLVALIIFIIVFGVAVVFYACFATQFLQTHLPSLQTTHIETMVVKSWRAQVSIQVTFELPSGIKASPQLGTFVLSTTTNKNLTLQAVVDGVYSISGNNQLILLEFESPWLLPLNKSDNETTWMWLEGDFKMHVKATHFPLVPKAERHTKFLCSVFFQNAQLRPQRCYVTYPVFFRS